MENSIKHPFAAGTVEAHYLDTTRRGPIMALAYVRHGIVCYNAKYVRNFIFISTRDNYGREHSVSRIRQRGYATPLPCDIPAVERNIITPPCPWAPISAPPYPNELPVTSIPGHVGRELCIMEAVYEEPIPITRQELHPFRPNYYETANRMRSSTQPLWNGGNMLNVNWPNAGLRRVAIQMSSGPTVYFLEPMEPYTLDSIYSFACTMHEALLRSAREYTRLYMEMNPTTYQREELIRHIIETKYEEGFHILIENTLTGDLKYNLNIYFQAYGRPTAFSPPHNPATDRT